MARKTHAETICASDEGSKFDHQLRRRQAGQCLQIHDLEEIAVDDIFTVAVLTIGRVVSINTSKRTLEFANNRT